MKNDVAKQKPEPQKSAIITLMQREVETASGVIAASPEGIKPMGFRTLARTLRAHAKSLESEAQRIETTEYQKAVSAYRSGQEATQ